MSQKNKESRARVGSVLMTDAQLYVFHDYAPHAFRPTETKWTNCCKQDAKTFAAQPLSWPTFADLNVQTGIYDTQCLEMKHLTCTLQKFRLEFGAKEKQIKTISRLIPNLCRCHCTMIRASRQKFEKHSILLQI